MKEIKISRSITERTPLLSAYMQDISRFPVLTILEEEELTALAHAGDAKAKQRLVECNLRFVISVAKQFMHLGMPLEDLIMEGNLGLMNAIERFNPTLGFKLSTYAVWWIRQSILQALAEQSRIVRLPLNKIGSMNKITKTYARLEQEFERTPNPEEVALELDISDAEVKESLRHSGKHLSMDAPLATDEENTMYDFMKNEDGDTPESELMYESLKLEINRALATLTPKEGDILKMFFGLEGYPPMTLDEIGENFDLTRERVRQIKEKAIKRLKNTSRSHILQSYLGQ